MAHTKTGADAWSKRHADTTAAAGAIIDSEAKAREAKTEELRAARLARENSAAAKRDQ